MCSSDLIKQQELQLKAQKFMAEAAEKNDRLDIERERIAAQKEIAAMQVGAKAEKDKMDNETKQHLEGMRVGVDIAKTKDQLRMQHIQRQQVAKQPEKKEKPKE